MSVYALAERLGKSIAEIEALSWVEFLGWCDYYNRNKSDQGKPELNLDEMSPEQLGILFR